VQPGEGEPRRACGREEKAHNILMSAGASEVAVTQKKSQKCDSGANDGRQSATPVAICGGL
jgi:hypothetical protein